MKISFTVYSDIHHHHWTTGVSLDDTLSVENDITNFAIEDCSDFVLFCGDRFESRNPHDEIKVRADALLKERNDSFGKPCFYLTGNHDKWWRRPVSGSTYSSCKVFQDRLDKVVIMDECQTYEHKLLPNVLIHALPADQEFSIDNYLVNPAKFNILVFHDLLIGTVVDMNGHKTTTGLVPSILDLPIFDVVFGGDEHIPQKIPFKNTKGGYVGSTLQFTRRDRGSDRGWIKASLEMSNNQHSELKTEFIVSGSPCFVECELEEAFQVSDAIPRVAMKVREAYDSVINGNIVSVFMRGSRQDVDQIVTDQWEKEFVEKTGARKVSLFKVIDSSLPVKLGDIQSADNSPEKDLDLYMQSGMTSLEGLDTTKIKELSQVVFKEIR
jgi:DNA repair exonuclease SbcCD nuclease subunit